jgi:hypothetical protein
VELDSSSGHTEPSLPAPSGTDGPSWGLFPLQRHRQRGPLTRASNPVRSVFRVSHPPDGLLPPLPSDLEDRYHSWGSPFRAFPPRRAVRLSAPVPFLPFLTSRSPALRTRRSGCPAASRSCSLRGSVPSDVPEDVEEPILSWGFAPRARCLRSPRNRLPGSFPPAGGRFFSGR